ncbi:MAG TPA: hypothetical protein VIG74_00710 [Alphaproteobacteria bacterium]|jgi:hypothetical protein
MIYLGMSYRQLAQEPEWVLRLARIRMAEEAEYQNYQVRKAKTN